MKRIVWLTGHSTSGKTTLAKNFQKRNKGWLLLDGDEMRESISLGLGFSKSERKIHNLNVARLAKILSRQTNVIVAVIAPMEDIRKEITKICNPIWVWIKRDIPEREGHFYEVNYDYDHIENDGNINDATTYLEAIIEIEGLYDR